MSAVKERSRRSTAGVRLSNLEGKALEADENFWKDEKWQEDDDNDAYMDESERDEFDPDFNDSENEEDEDTENGANGNREEEPKLMESNGTSSATTASPQQKQFVGGRRSIGQAWTTFFHARSSPQACKLGGAMRIAFAFLYLCDRLLWQLDIDFLLSPSEGVIPFEVGQQQMGEHQYSLLALAPQSDTWLWTIHYVSLFCGVLLLLGVAPRLQVVAIYIMMISFENSNTLCFDGQDVMFRTWASLFFFLPLHRYSIWGLWKKKSTTSTGTKDTASWPMWPFRLFQLQMCFIYTGASWGKLLDGNNWISGNAIWRVSHMNDFYGGPFNPEFVFNVLGPLKLLCWASLAIESTCWIFIWPKATRIPMLVAIVGFHVGIDLAMNMHCFEWLAILGWMSFLATPGIPDAALPKADKHNTAQPKKRCVYRWSGNLLLATHLLHTWASTNAGGFIEDAAPSVFKPIFKGYNDAAKHIETLAEPFATTLGLKQGPWDMFAGIVDTRHKAFLINVTLIDGEVIESSSPDWDSMTWWQKKRYMRPMDFSENLSAKRNVHGHKAICQAFAREYDNVATVELSFAWRDAPDVPPTDLGWWDYPARQPIDTYYVESYYTLNVNANLEEMCDMWASDGECVANPGYMWEGCAKSCLAQRCEHPDSVKVGDRLSIPKDAGAYFIPCTVLVERTNRSGKCKVKVEEGSCKELENGWVDLYEQNRKFHIIKPKVASMKEEDGEEL
jgi:hypothetical protein